MRYLASLIAASLLLAGITHAEEHEGRRLAMPAKVNAAWKTECGSCHMAYPPGLLPGRSWNALMDNLSHHFGSNASLDKGTEAEIRQFLLYASSDRDTRPAKAAPGERIVTRITDTARFADWHEEVRADVFRRQSVGSAANCMACHRGAEQGNFDEHQVRIPR